MRERTERLGGLLTELRTRSSKRGHPGACWGAFLAILAGVATPVAAVARDQVAQDRQEEPKPETSVSRLLIPKKPHPPELTKVIAKLRTRSRLALSFQDASLGEIVKNITKTSGVQVYVSKTVSQKKVTLEARGDLTLIEVFHRLNRMGDTYAVVERGGVVRVLSVEEYRRFAKATGGKVGEPLPVPGYFPQLEFRVLAYSGKAGLDVDLPAEKKRLMAWLETAKNREQVLEDPQRIARYLGLATDRGGRLSKDIRWIPCRIEPRGRRAFQCSNSNGHAAATLTLFSKERLMGGPKTEDDYLVEFLAVNMKERGFTTMDLIPQSLSKSKAAIGLALVYEIKEESAKSYSDLTARNIRRGMAIILDGYLIGAPRIMSRIPGTGQVMGLSEAKIDRVVKALKR